MKIAAAVDRLAQNITKHQADQPIMTHQENISIRVLEQLFLEERVEARLNLGACFPARKAKIGTAGVVGLPDLRIGLLEFSIQHIAYGTIINFSKSRIAVIDK